MTFLKSAEQRLQVCLQMIACFVDLGWLGEAMRSLANLAWLEVLITWESLLGVNPEIPKVELPTSLPRALGHGSVSCVAAFRSARKDQLLVNLPLGFLRTPPPPPEGTPPDADFFWYSIPVVQWIAAIPFYLMGSPQNYPSKDHARIPLSSTA